MHAVREITGGVNQPVKGELAKQLNIGLKAAEQAVENYNRVLQKWNKGMFEDGARARIDGHERYSAPSVQVVGQFARESWLAGWDDADAALKRDGGRENNAN